MIFFFVFVNFKVPPGHMIQQIVDENGTLKHIILSSLNANSFISNQQHQQQQQQQQQQQPYCCCCSNTCAQQPVNSASGTSLTSAVVPASNGNPLVAAATANQMIQPQINSTMVFPALSYSPANTYVRNRRSIRNYSSPNKRLSYNNGVNNMNYYSTSTVTKGTGNLTRYMKSQLDNLKSNHYNRYNNTAMNYDRLPVFEHGHTDGHNNKYSTYSKSSYDYSYNSSNNSQTPTLDQMNNNLKYYKDHDQHSADNDHYTKKSYLSLNSEIKNCYLDEYTPEEDDNLTNGGENMSQKSSLCESIDTNHDDYIITNEANNYDLNYNQHSNLTTPESIHKTEVKNHNEPNDDDTDCNICDTESKSKSNTSKTNSTVNTTNKKLLDNNNSTDQKCNSKTKPIIVLDDSNASDILLKPNKSDNEKRNSDNKLDCKEEKCRPVSENSAIANADLDHLLDLPYSNFSSEQMETDKTESESEENKENSSICSPMRSPKHLLPKVEALTLICTNVTSSSVRLKWNFSQPGEYPEQKRHYIVDQLLNNQSTDESPSTRMAHQGPNTSCRVGHLQSQHEYMFRVRTSTDTAWLVSNILTVVTPESTPSFNRNGRRTNKQLHHQVTQQQQLIYQQQQQLLQHQHIMEQEKQKQLLACNGDLTNSSVMSTDRGYAFLLLLVFTIISLIMAVLINHFLGNHW